MIENVSTQLTVFHCFAHCLLPGRAFASLYALLFLEKEAEIGGRADRPQSKMSILVTDVDKNPYRVLIAIGDKWQSTTLFLAILIRFSLLLRAFSIATYPL